MKSGSRLGLSWNRFLSVVAVLLAVSVLAAPDAFAQTTNGTIRGTINDETGGALPGVTVVATSPALLVAQIVVVSGGDGNYLLPELPIGEYQVTYELGGFQQFVRSEIDIPSRFTATINVTMVIGALTESITVAGASPVVDVASTTNQQRLTTESLVDVIPVTRTIQDFAATMPGITPGRRPNIGGGEPTGGVFDTSYASSSQQGTYLVDGVDARQGGGGGQLAGHAPDLASMEELSISTVAGSAEQALPGVYISMIIKSGGNQFAGRYEAQLQSGRFQGNNLPQLIKDQGVNIGDATVYNREYTADIGGPILRDRLWFYGAVRHQGTQKNTLGFAFTPGADGEYGTTDDLPGVRDSSLRNLTGKFTLQLSQNYKFIAMYTHNREDFPMGISQNGRSTPFEATNRMLWQPNEQKIEIQGSPSSRMVFDLRLGRNYYLVSYSAKPAGYNALCDCTLASRPSQYDNDTRINTGPSLSLAQRPRERWQPMGSLSWFPENEALGTHEIKTGFNFYKEYHGTGSNEGLAGNYRLYFDTVGGVASQPYEFRAYNYPLRQRNNMNETGIYVQDTWRPHDQLTLNLGLRLDTFRAWVPPQSKAPAGFGFLGGDFPKTDVLNWREVAPRLGIAYNLTGDGKTVAKFTYGHYNMTPADSFAGAYNKNGVAWHQYSWNDLNGNRDYDPGEVDLDINGPDFQGLSSARNNIINPDLRNPTTKELTVSVEREIGADMGLSVTYIKVNEQDLYENVNVLRPYSAYTIPLSFTDPGPDGTVGTADDGAVGAVTVWDYPASMKGAAFVGNKRTNRASGDGPHTQTLEVTMTKRQTGRWSVLASAAATKWDQPRNGIEETPNEAYFNVNDTWSWQAKMTGSIELPYEMSLNGTAQIYNGLPGARTARFRTPNGNVTLRMEPLGAQSSGARPVLNTRLSKNLSLGGGQSRVRLSLDLLNILNNSSPWSVNYASGVTFGDIRTIDLPRIARFSFSYRF